MSFITGWEMKDDTQLTSINCAKYKNGANIYKENVWMYVVWFYITSLMQPTQF